MDRRYKKGIFTVILYMSSCLKVVQSQRVRCLENSRFYRNPERLPQRIWDSQECSQYFLCIEGEVFEFRCSPGLLFDIKKQICDFESSVSNCDVTSDMLNGTQSCPDKHSPCQDGSCLPQEYFCDGSNDCPDGSDENNCNHKDDPNVARPCNTNRCSLPSCFCSSTGTQIPENLASTHVPQMIVLTFDGALTQGMSELLSKFVLNEEIKNPNGCPIRGTFFITHRHNNYQFTQKLWNEGHEIAVNSITHRSPEDWWSFNATLEDWFDEMVGQANVLHKFAGIRLNQIRGMRAPFRRLGWNRQFLMMKEFGFMYDGSILAPLSDPPLWPYTLDYKIPHKCVNTKKNCPSRSYPGIWEMVINPLESGDYLCPTISSCPKNFTGQDIYATMTYNFKRHYLTNRAPYGLHFQSAWFKNSRYVNALKQFIADVRKYPDVWFVTEWQALKWMENPTSSEKLHRFQPWSCGRFFRESEIVCNIPNACRYYNDGLNQDQDLYTCMECPRRYPWIKNELGAD